MNRGGFCLVVELAGGECVTIGATPSSCVAYLQHPLLVVLHTAGNISPNLIRLSGFAPWQPMSGFTMCQCIVYNLELPLGLDKS